MIIINWQKNNQIKVKFQTSTRTDVLVAFQQITSMSLENCSRWPFLSLMKRVLNNKNWRKNIGNLRFSRAYFSLYNPLKFRSKLFLTKPFILTRILETYFSSRWNHTLTIGPLKSNSLGIGIFHPLLLSKLFRVNRFNSQLPLQVLLGKNLYSINYFKWNYVKKKYLKNCIQINIIGKPFYLFIYNIIKWFNM